MTIIITTPHGNRYCVDPVTGNINGSHEWRMIGLASVRSDRVCVSLRDLTPDTVSKLSLKYKNGNPRYTVMDVDHGTRRAWGNTKYHGVKAIYFESEEAK